MFKVLCVIVLFLIASSIYSQKNYYVSKSGDGDFITIAQVNSARLNTGDIVSFKSGQQFSDDILKCQYGVTYNSYGSLQKAIIGDTTSTLTSIATISIDKPNVTLENLAIYGYKSAYKVINYSVGEWTLKNCFVIGGVNSHDVMTDIIDYSYVDINTCKNILITHNMIRDGRIGIRFRYPNNFIIEYNDIYNMYTYKGKVNYNAGSGIVNDANYYSVIDDYWDAKYTLIIKNNNIHHFEAMAMDHLPSNSLVEYNEIHHNLDERIFFGGPKHGNVGKIHDATSSTKKSTIGTIFRYNYVHDLIQHGESGYIYGLPTKEQIIAGTPVIESTNNGSNRAWYHWANGPDSDYGQYYGDNEAPDNVISGQGYGNMWIHNNIFYNCSNKVFSHVGDYTSEGWQEKYATHYLNNTILNCGWSYTANENLITEEHTSSPLYFINNIIDYNNSNAKYAGYFKKSKSLYMDYNIYIKQNGIVINGGNSGANYATRYNTSDVNNWEGLNEQYLTNPNWVNPSSTIFVPNVGPKGVYMPNVSILKDGHAYNKGMDYDLLGDNFTVLAKKHTLGKDPTGRSFAYDILGNYRATNDIGAVGIGSSINPQPTYNKPIITKQPGNYSANTGDNIKFTVSATPQDEIGFQWWKNPFINGVESKITNNAKYSGANTNTLNINNVNSEDANVKYVCEVYNKNDPQNLWVNSEPASIILRQNLDPLKSNGLKVFMEAVYDNGQMENNLSNLLPNSQPYNTLPWNLELNETIDEVKANYIDWVIIELRKSEKQITYRKPGIITNNGFIVNSDGTKLSFKNVVSDKYYIAIKHRNHLGIMSSLKVDVNNNEPILYDFTASQNSVYGVNPMAELGDGNFGLYSGDADANGVINNLDFGKVANNIPFKGYSNSDLDMNGSVNVLDYNKINKNILKFSKIPK